MLRQRAMLMAGVATTLPHRCSRPFLRSWPPTRLPSTRPTMVRVAPRPAHLARASSRGQQGAAHLVPQLLHPATATTRQPRCIITHNVEVAVTGPAPCTTAIIAQLHLPLTARLQLREVGQVPACLVLGLAAGRSLWRACAQGWWCEEPGDAS